MAQFRKSLARNSKTASCSSALTRAPTGEWDVRPCAGPSRRSGRLPQVPATRQAASVLYKKPELAGAAARRTIDPMQRHQSRAGSRSDNAQQLLVLAYMRLFVLPKRPDGSKLTTLASFGAYRVRLVELTSRSEMAPSTLDRAVRWSSRSGHRQCRLPRFSGRGSDRGGVHGRGGPPERDRSAQHELTMTVARSVSAGAMPLRLQAAMMIPAAKR